MKGSPLPPIRPSNSAILVHDMQNDFLKAKLSNPEIAEAVKRTRQLIDLAHSLKMPVIYTRAEMDPKMEDKGERSPYLHFQGISHKTCVKGTPGSEIIDELRPAAEDIEIIKVRSSAFYGTKLDAVLRWKGVWILIVAGGVTNWGVEWVARDAVTRDIVTVALRDCTYSWTPEAQAASLENIDTFLGYVMNSGEVIKILSESK